MSRLLSFSFYFSLRPNPDFRYTKLTIIIGILLILIGIAIHIYRRKFATDPIIKKMIRKYPGAFKWFGALLLVLLYFRESGIPYLSMRLWWLIWIGLFLYKVIKEAVTFKKNYKTRVSRSKHNSSKDKYIPRPKRKR